MDEPLREWLNGSGRLGALGLYIPTEAELAAFADDDTSDPPQPEVIP